MARVRLGGSARRAGAKPRDAGSGAGGMWLLAIALLAGAGCSEPMPEMQAEANPFPSASAPEIRVTGRLTDEGVECQALRGEDGRLYTLAGDVRGFGPGERVTVEGKVAELSFCMQGTTLAVTRIEPAR